jgi:hypothetical protein
MADRTPSKPPQEKRGGWLSRFAPGVRKIVSRRETPDNLWVKDPDSGDMLYRPDLEAALWVTPSGRHMRINAPQLEASTQMLAGHIGESESPEVICHGRDLHVFVAPLSQEFALLAIFPNRVAVGLIRLQAKRVAAGIMADLRQIIRNVTTLAPATGAPPVEDRENPFLRYN